MLPKSFMTEQSMLTLQVLQQRLDALMLRDKQRFARRLHGVKKVKILMRNRPFSRRWRKKLNRLRRRSLSAKRRALNHLSAKFTC